MPEDLLRGTLRLLRRALRPAPFDRRRGRGPEPSKPATTVGGYPGDFRGRPRIVYEPFDDDHADPGEVVWTWVPYEEDHRQGKDRPVVVIGRDGPSTFMSSAPTSMPRPSIRIKR